MRQVFLKCLRDGKDMVLTNGKYSLHYRCERGQYRDKLNNRFCSNSVSFNDKLTLQSHLDDLLETTGLMEKEKGEVENINGNIIKYEIEEIGDEYIIVGIDLERRDKNAINIR